MRHVNIPVFIPHLGCPNQCVFCNQKSISGVNNFCVDDVKNIIENALRTINYEAEVEIAFFGGSFTGIDRNLMISLLELAYSYIKSGKLSSIRCSTRPDYIDKEIVDILKKYHVTTVELGLQSVDDEVLETSKRGHIFEAERKACKLIVESGIGLVGQMMIGLPNSSIESEIKTAKFIISSGAVGARIYPTIVFKNTELFDMALEGKYNPLDLDDAIKRSAIILELFAEAKIDVIRIGLQSSENLLDRNHYFAGPNHPALGELVIGELFFNKIDRILSSSKIEKGQLISIFVPKGSLSKVIGQNKRNKLRLFAKYGKLEFIEIDELSEYEIMVRTKDGENKCI